MGSPHGAVFCVDVVPPGTRAGGWTNVICASAGDEITPKDRESSKTLFKDGSELTKNRVVEVPKREDIPFGFNNGRVCVYRSAPGKGPARAGRDL